MSFFFFFVGSLIYRVRGIDPDGDKLIFGVREPGNKVIRIENFGKSEANIYLKIELDREVMENFINNDKLSSSFVCIDVLFFIFFYRRKTNILLC